MRISVVGHTQAAAMLAKAGDTSQLADVTKGAADRIVESWEGHIPVGPTGLSSESHFVDDEGTAGTVQAEAVNYHFVTQFLQFGTSKMAPKVDLFGQAQPHIERWQQDVAKALL